MQNRHLTRFTRIARVTFHEAGGEFANSRLARAIKIAILSSETNVMDHSNGQSSFDTNRRMIPDGTIITPVLCRGCLKLLESAFDKKGKKKETKTENSVVVASKRTPCITRRLLYTEWGTVLFTLKWLSANLERRPSFNQAGQFKQPGFTQRNHLIFDVKHDYRITVRNSRLFVQVASGARNFQMVYLPS